jgi:hypothetical protein
LKKIDSWQTKVFLWIGLPAIAVIGLVFGSADLVPAWQAKGGTGTPGTFTAVREDCGRRSCTWHGDWVATDGSKTRSDVILYDEPEAMRAGTKTEALDSGARNGVFSTAGGSTYLLVSGLTLAGLLAAIGFIVFLVKKIRGRGRAADQEKALDFS